MFKKFITKVGTFNLVIFFVLLASTAAKFYLPPNDSLLNSISNLSIFLKIIFGMAMVNLLIFFLAALFYGNKRKAWWEAKNSNEKRNEFWLSLWMKSLLVSFIVFILGAAIIILLGDVWVLFLFFLFFTVQYILGSFTRKANH